MLYKGSYMIHCCVTGDSVALCVISDKKVTHSVTFWVICRVPKEQRKVKRLHRKNAKNFFRLRGKPFSLLKEKYGCVGTEIACNNKQIHLLKMSQYRRKD